MTFYNNNGHYIYSHAKTTKPSLSRTLRNFEKFYALWWYTTRTTPLTVSTFTAQYTTTAYYNRRSTTTRYFKP